LASCLGVDVVVAVHALAAREVDLGQLHAECPAAAQKRQRQLSKRCLRSSSVSLPSFPSLPVRSGTEEEGLDGLGALLEREL
jgi:hypothetical protein